MFGVTYTLKLTNGTKRYADFRTATEIRCVERWNWWWRGGLVWNPPDSVGKGISRADFSSSTETYSTASRIHVAPFHSKCNHSATLPTKKSSQLIN